MPSDEKFMREAILLAKRGAGQTRPNPAVGCVIVRHDRIIGRGWHRRAGQPHAEVEALRSMRRFSPRGATAYITLEPCSTHGRTPPCTEALIAAGVAKVVAGATDPDPRHRGRGFIALEKAGIETVAGVLAEECEALNPEFHHAMSTGLPWVIAKCGMSLDGRLTRPPGEGRWLTSPAARADAMKLRARVDAVLVGAATVRADNPALTVRGLPGTPQPWRAVWTPGRPAPRGSKLFRDRWKHRTLVLRESTLRAALRDLASRGVQAVLIEGGGHTLGRAFGSGLVNEVVFYIAPLLAGGSIPAVGGRPIPAFRGMLRNPSCGQIGGCLRFHALLGPSKVR